MVVVVDVAVVVVDSTPPETYSGRICRIRTSLWVNRSLSRLLKDPLKEIGQVQSIFPCHLIGSLGRNDENGTMSVPSSNEQ